MQRYPFGWTPITWAKLPVLRDVVGAVLPPRAPAIWVISMPRSGSSWLGSILAAHPRTLYFREPITEVFLRQRKLYDAAESEIDTPGRRALFDDACRTVMRGIPAFPRNVVASDVVADPAHRWAVGARRQARVLVKEVNPLLLARLLETYAPMIVHIYRHPAPVALSYRKLGWGVGGGLREGVAKMICAAAIPDADIAWFEHDDCDWRQFGFRYAVIVGWAMAVLDGRANAHTVSYEALCADPFAEMRAILDQVGLDWHPALERHLAGTAFGVDDGDPYSVSRRSQAVANAWRGQISAENLARLREGVARVPGMAELFEW
jgi:hypothetical protein